MTTWAVVIAGGVGRRLWPWSRARRPKPVLDLPGRGTLLAATIARLPVPMERVLVVTGAAMAEAVRLAVPDLPADAVLVEPEPRNTGPAVAWGITEAALRGASRVAVFPADHAVADVVAFRAAVSAALEAVEDGALGLIGVQPTEPSPHYGYLRLGESVGAARRVVSFVEKPTVVDAAAMLAAGDVCWNTGMFLGRVEAFRAALARHLPATATAMDAVLAGAPLEQVWSGTDEVSFDVGVLERHDRVVAVTAELGWSDLGTFEAMAPWLTPHAGGAGLADEVVSRDSEHNLVVTPGRRVILVGARRLLIVDDGDVLVVADRDSSEALAALSGELALRDPSWR